MARRDEAGRNAARRHAGSARPREFVFKHPQFGERRRSARPSAPTQPLRSQRRLHQVVTPWAGAAQCYVPDFTFVMRERISGHPRSRPKACRVRDLPLYGLFIAGGANADSCPMWHLACLRSSQHAFSSARCTMWNWISCYVTGHDYSVSCKGGSIFLRCLICGRRSQGWVVCGQGRTPTRIGLGACRQRALSRGEHRVGVGVTAGAALTLGRASDLVGPAADVDRFRARRSHLSNRLMTSGAASPSRRASCSSARAAIRRRRWTPSKPASTSRSIARSPRHLAAIYQRRRGGDPHATPEAFGSTLLSTTGTPAHVRELSPSRAHLLRRSQPKPRSTRASACRSFPRSFAKAVTKSKRPPPAGCPLLRCRDIRGDLHMHTLYSDGGTAAAMVEACAALGYEYMAITDHS